MPIEISDARLAQHGPDSGPSAPGGTSAGPSASYRLRRYRDTALRLKWYLAALLATGAVGGIAATRFVHPQFVASGTILVEKESADDRSGPIREAGLLETSGWIDVIRSNRVVDTVVIRTGYNVVGGDKRSNAITAGARTSPGYVPGRYQLVLSGGGTRYILKDDRTGAEIERGSLPDTIGARIGLQLPVGAGLEDGELRFSLARVREAGEWLLSNLRTTTRERTQFIGVELQGEDPVRLASVLNVWLEEFVKVAAELKSRRGSGYLAILEQQVELTSERLRIAESALEGLRASVIGGSDDGTALRSGLESTRDPLMRELLNNRLALDEVRRDKDALSQLLSAREGVSVAGLSALTTVLERNDALRSAIADLADKESRLRSARQVYGEEHPTVRDLASTVEATRRQTIPELARNALQQLDFREQTLSRTVNSYSSELKRVPARSLEEARRRRDLTVAEETYAQVLARYNQVRLSNAALGPDVAVFDYAQTPILPAVNPKLRVVAGGFGAGVALAMLLLFVADKRDSRFRYAEQATNELGLEVLGFVPRLPTGEREDPLAAAQAVEAFRSLRLRLQNDATDNPRVRVVFTSPGIGDGKTLLVHNLAISFADAGMRTLIIDGDVRRGRQAAMFGLPNSPGLADVLQGSIDGPAAVRETHVPRLSLLTCGTRSAKVPELLHRDRLAAALAAVEHDFDVVLVDSAPLGAGIDAYALGVSVGCMVVVLRVDHSDAGMANNRLGVLDSLPVRVMGAVLNDVRASKGFEYYTFYDEYLEAGLAPSTGKDQLLPAPAEGPSPG